MSDYTENRNAALNVVAELNRKYDARSTCFVKTPYMNDWRPTRLASPFQCSALKVAIVVKVDGLSEPVVTQWLALPDSPVYEGFIQDADEARDAQYTERFQSAKLKAINVTTFLQELRGDLSQHFTSIPDGQMSHTDFGMTFAEYENQAEKLQEAGLFADSYHTFDELYKHRVRLFICLMHAHRNRAWWSHWHHDGSRMAGWIIAGITTPEGEATYHLPVTEVMHLPKGIEQHRGNAWDGHTPDDVLQRLLSLNNGMTDGSSFEHLPLPTECVFQYSASVNLPQGVIHFDGIVTGKEIASIEDYQHYRAMIAADAKAQPEQVQVHSFCIVGAK